MACLFGNLLLIALALFAGAAAQGQYSEIWGTSYRGGSHDYGYLFRMPADASSFEIVHHFKGGIHGKWPNGALTEGADKRLYGLTAQGGAHDKGVIYSYDPQREVFTLEYHPDIHIGQKFLRAPDGKLYVMSTDRRGSLYAYDPVNRSLDLVYDYPIEEGRSPFTEPNLLLVDDHRIIGTTYSGGDLDDGVLFEYDLTTETWSVLHSFGGEEGRSPSPTLAIQGRRIYGSTLWGGDFGSGALFSYDLDSNTFQEEVHFVAENRWASGVGIGPYENLYLQAPTGGINYHGGVLRFDPVSKNLDIVHSFATTGTNITTGSLVTTWAGRLFGVTRYGGSGSGLGTIYEIDPTTDSLTTIQSFNDGFPNESRLLEVGERPVTSVAIQAPATHINVDNGTLALTAALIPAETSHQPVVWSVDNPAVATINANGILTAASNGTVTVTGTANYGLGIHDTITITVTNQDGIAPAIPVESLSPSHPQVFFTAYGDTQQLAVEAFPANASDQEVTWQTSDPNVATVSTAGLLQAIGSGTATITATAQDGSDVSTNLIVSVTQLITSLSITPSTSALDQPGQTIDFDVIVTPDNASNPEVTWSVNNITASIDTDGVLTPLGNGTITVTANTTDGSLVSATRELTMSNQYTPVQVINAYVTTSFSKRSTINENIGTLQMQVAHFPLDATDTTMNWISSNPSVANVDSSGLVSALQNGITTITATSADGPSDTHEIVVSNQEAGPLTATSITVKPQTAAIYRPGDTLQAAATILPEGAAETQVTWVMVGDHARINNAGLITALSDGTVHFSAQTQNIYGATVQSGYATLTISNQDASLSQEKLSFSNAARKLCFTHTRFLPPSEIAPQYEGSTDLIDWTPLVADIDYTILSSTDQGDGTETLILELTDEALAYYFLKVSEAD